MPVSNMSLSGSVRADDTGTLTRAKSQGLVEMSECIFYIYTGTFPLTLTFLTRVIFTRVKHPCHLVRHCLRDWSAAHNSRLRCIEARVFRTEYVPAP
jgi:hypothetical protein